MSAHATPDDELREPAGAVLLPMFTIALVVAVVVIALVIAYPSLVALVAAMTTVVGFTAGIVLVLSHLIGPDEH